MRFIVRFLKAVGNFLDHRFPERMTVEEVLTAFRAEKEFHRVTLKKMEDRVILLEDQHNKMVTKITSLQVLSGIRGAMAERE
jgi:hypothetical protein